MIYDSEVSFVLPMQNRCALFVALYFPGLVTWQFYSFPYFSIKPPLCVWKAASHRADSYFCLSLEEGSGLLSAGTLQFHL